MKRATPLYYLFMGVVAQVCGFGLALLLARNFQTLQRPLAFTCIAGLVALALSRLAKVSLPWQVLNLILPTAAYMFNHHPVPSWLPLSLCALAVIIYLPTFWTHVPFYPTSTLMYEEIARRLPMDREFRFVDLGSGYGSLVIYLAKRFPKGTFVGSEIAPLPFLVSWARTVGRKNARFYFKSFWKLDFSQFDVLYAFLSPTPMQELWQKVRNEARAGSIFMTNTFAVDAKPDELVQVDDARRCILYVHKMSG